MKFNSLREKSPQRCNKLHQFEGKKQNIHEKRPIKEVELEIRFKVETRSQESNALIQLERNQGLNCCWDLLVEIELTGAVGPKLFGLG